MLDVVCYSDLINSALPVAKLEEPLLREGMIGISDVPGFEQKYNEYIKVAGQFALLDEIIKQHYAPARDSGLTEGYEIGVEWFKNSKGDWQIDEQKASYLCVRARSPIK